jgi:hypothetical protein
MKAGACAVLWCERTAPDDNKKPSPPNWHDSKAKSGSGTPPQPNATSDASNMRQACPKLYSLSFILGDGNNYHDC